MRTEFPDPANETIEEGECGISTNWRSDVRDAVIPPGASSRSIGTASDRCWRSALGATLYVPATKEGLAGTVRRQAAAGAKAMVIDLEDAIPDVSVDSALTSTQRDAARPARRSAGEPAVRPGALGGADPAAGRRVGPGAGHRQRVRAAEVLGRRPGREYLQAVADAGDAVRRTVLYAMPVLETPEVLYRETREAELVGIRELLDEYRELVLTIRIGATDLCGLFGIRRDRDLSIYDVGVAADLIAQVVNQLGRTDGTGFAITGPVWEYFANHERILRPQLRQTPFDERHAAGLRRQLMSTDLDGLMRETMLDRANGLTGKSVIHPSHIAPVHALAVVPHEEYLDALDVLAPESAAGGVAALGVPEQDERDAAAPDLGGAHDAAGASFRRCRPGISHVDIMRRSAAADDGRVRRPGQPGRGAGGWADREIRHRAGRSAARRWD